MSNAPERIWAEPPDVFDGMGFWMERARDDLVEYVRADLMTAALDRAEAETAAAVLAERERLAVKLHRYLVTHYQTTAHRAESIANNCIRAQGGEG